jgi:hypothetical protein
VDLAGNQLDLDADDDTSITADTDDQVDVEIGGADIQVWKDFGAGEVSTDTTRHLLEIADSTNVMSAGTNVLSAFNIDLGIGNSTGGTNNVYGVLIDDITADAENTETAIDIAGTGWDVGIGLGGNVLDLDADDDTSITADSDDQVDLEIGGADEWVFGADQLDATNGQIVNIGAAGTDFGTDGSLTLAGDLTVSEDSTGGNAGARSQVIGMPAIQLVALGTMTNGSTESANYLDDNPTGEWTEVDAGTNLVVTADSSVYRVGSTSLQIEFTDVVENDGVTGTAGDQDNLSSNESIGFWIYSDVAITAGDFNLVVDDSDGTDQTYDIGAVSATVWTWKEIDISGCDANCDTMDNINILATSQGGTNLTAANVYLDGMWKWDADDEEALGVNLVQDGVLSVVTIVTAQDQANTPSVPAEQTDYVVNYQSGNDVIVTTTDQSANSGVALVAYQ